MDSMKTCTLCEETKPFSEFTKHRAMKDGLSYWCRDCNNKRTKAFRESPSGIYTGIIARSKHYKKTGRKVSKPINITREEFVAWYNSQPRFCAYCDIAEEDLFLLHEHYKMNRARLSVDCMDNLKGYFLGNIVLACGRCNFIKSDTFTHEEMRFLAQEHIKPKWMRQKEKWRDYKTVFRHGSIFPTAKIEKGEEDEEN